MEKPTASSLQPTLGNAVARMVLPESAQGDEASPGLTSGIGLCTARPSRITSHLSFPTCEAGEESASCALPSPRVCSGGSSDPSLFLATRHCSRPLMTHRPPTVPPATQEGSNASMVRHMLTYPVSIFIRTYAGFSGRRRRACALASVRRPNCPYAFRVGSFHEDSAMPGCERRN